LEGRVVGLLRARLTRTLDLGGQGGVAGDGDVGRHQLEGLGADAFHLHQVRGLLERPMLRPVLDDPLRGHITDARQQRELRRLRGVDVDHTRGRGRLVGHGDRADRREDESESEDVKGLPHVVCTPFFSVCVCVEVVWFGCSTRIPVSTTTSFRFTSFRSAQITTSFAADRFKRAATGTRWLSR
jgi:hypothetical protein